MKTIFVQYQRELIYVFLNNVDLMLLQMKLEAA